MLEKDDAHIARDGPDIFSFRDPYLICPTLLVFWVHYFDHHNLPYLHPLKNAIMAYVPVKLALF